MHDELQDATEQIITRLQSLRRFAGPTDAFWSEYLDCVGRMALARRVRLLVRPAADAPWRISTTWPRLPGDPGGEDSASSGSRELADATWERGHGVRPGGGAGPGEVARIAIRIETGGEGPAMVLELEVESAAEDELEAMTLPLRMLADIPANYQRERALDQASGDVLRFAETLEVMTLLDADKRWIQAGMTLCNELAPRYECSRVSLGWEIGDYVVLQAMSHMEAFEKRTTAVQALEASMQECLDQDEEILWPAPSGPGPVALCHDEYARVASAASLVSLPVRVEGQPCGVLTCERTDRAFSAGQVAGLRLVCDQAARRLGDLRRHDRWFGARMLAGLREGLSWFLGVEKTFAKMIGIAVFLAFWYVLLGTWSYRIEGSFVLKTDDLIIVPAPFGGYIDRVHRQVGDEVREGEPLLDLDTRELLQEESAALAEVSRHLREAEKAQSRRALSEMKIAQALQAQAQARLDIARYRLEVARIGAPMAGLIIEGDLKKLLGAPVRKGDVLFKIARIEKMYAEVDVEEQDVHEWVAGRPGEIAFVSRPNRTFRVVVRKVDPVALPKNGRNVFTARAELSGSPEDWWRPGMSGIAKVEAGRRSIWWILTHRTVESLSLWFWW